MEPVGFEDLPESALLLLDSAPIIYVLESHPRFGPRFRPLFEAHAAGHLRFAVTTITIAEVLTGPLQAADERWRGGTVPSSSPGRLCRSTPISRKALRDCGRHSG